MRPATHGAADLTPEQLALRRKGQKFLAWTFGILGVLFVIGLFGNPPQQRAQSRAPTSGAGAATTSRPASRMSDTCGPISGESSTDVDNVERFCARVIPKGLDVQSARAHEMLLWLQINRGLADHLRRDRLTTEQVMKTWMSTWRNISGSTSVNIYVMWQQVEIVKGDTTIFSGDVVTIK